MSTIAGQLLDSKTEEGSTGRSAEKRLDKSPPPLILHARRLVATPFVAIFSPSSAAAADVRTTE